jgi:hypothetical protein
MFISNSNYPPLGTESASIPPHLITLIDQRRSGDALEYLEARGITGNYAVFILGELQRIGGAR